MKKIVFIGLTVAFLCACNEKDEWNVEFIEPLLEDGSTELSRRE
jgi:hypothetical protein